MYLIYTLLLRLAFVLAMPVYAFRGRGKHLKSFGARLGKGLPHNATGRKAVWIHAVSVGEVLAARTLIAPLRRRLPDHPIFVSTTTLTGQAVAQNQLKTSVDGLFFAPFDFPGSVRRVLEAIDPALLVLVETEIWPAMIRETRKHGAHVAIVNGRLSPKSFDNYRRLRPMLSTFLEEIDLLLMQSEPHAQRAREIGAPPGHVKVLGNLKFDAVPPASGGNPLPDVPDAPLWIAGSTVPGEEEQVLQAFARVRQQHPTLRLMIAARHPERFSLVPPLVTAAGFSCARRSTLGERGWRDEDVLVLDTLGELARTYARATVVFVGGSLQPSGGHNVLEPAMAGKAVVVGPHMENFQEIADEFLAAQALVQVQDAQGLADATTRLLTNGRERAAIGQRARDLVQQNQGAVQRTVEALAGLVS